MVGLYVTRIEHGRRMAWGPVHHAQAAQRVPCTGTVYARQPSGAASNPALVRTLSVFISDRSRIGLLIQPESGGGGEGEEVQFRVGLQPTWVYPSLAPCLL